MKSFFRLNAIQGRNERPPDVSASRGLKPLTRQSGVQELERASQFSHTGCRNAIGVPMIHPDALRFKLVAIASVCAGADIPLPIRRDIARITGATLRQVHRHIPALRDRGAITTERRGGRCFVQEARP